MFTPREIRELRSLAIVNVEIRNVQQLSEFDFSNINGCKYSHFRTDTVARHIEACDVGPKITSKQRTLGDSESNMEKLVRQFFPTPVFLTPVFCHTCYPRT